jgi:flagellar protein FliO/FliZ
MDDLFYLRPILALIIVFCLIGLAAFIAKKLKLEERFTSRVSGGTTKKQLSVAETLVIDAKRKLVLVKRENTGHLLLLSPHGDTVIEQNIPLHSEVISLQEHLRSGEPKGQSYADTHSHKAS